MGWLGKIIGGTIGFILGGPLGLIAGAVFGNVFDHSGSSDNKGPYFNNSANFYKSETSMDQAQMVYFVGTFSMLAKLTQVDGNVTDTERKKVHDFMINDLHLSGKSYETADRIFREALNKKDISFEALASQFYQHFYNQQTILHSMIDILVRVAISDGQMSSSEESLINEAARIFRINDSFVDSIKRRYGVSSSYERAYAVLGLKSDAVESEIKKAYRKLSIDFHPDTVQAKGMSEEFKVYAEKHFREIQEAYDQIKKEKGIK